MIPLHKAYASINSPHQSSGACLVVPAETAASKVAPAAISQTWLQLAIVSALILLTETHAGK
jgi:hypothetical protein